MELIKIIEAKKVLEEIADKEDVSAHLSYWMAKFISKTQDEHEFFIEETRKLMDKYGSKGENGGYTIAKEKLSDFNCALYALQNTDVEDPGIRFSLSEMSRELKLSVKQMFPLLDFIREDE